MKRQLLSEMQEVHTPTSELLECSASTSSVTSAPGPSATTATPVLWADFDVQALSAQQHRTTGTAGTADAPLFKREE